jgi:hypothetical protein
MSTKRIVRWGIVLFLLLALPGLTGALAQSVESDGKITEVVDDKSWACNVTESEPNDSMASANPIQIGDVVCGDIEGEEGNCHDVDYFKFTLSSGRAVLYDASMRIVDQAICFSDDAGEWPACLTGSSYGPYFQYLPPGEYYISSFMYYDDDYCDLDYIVDVSSPLLISAAAGNLGTGTVAGIQFQSGDILSFSKYNNGQEWWSMFFDASDVGITKNVTNIDASNGDELRLSLGASQTLPDVGLVTPWDILVFDADFDDFNGLGGYGDRTNGTFRMGFDGSEHQLTTSGEKLDAIAGGRYCDFLSTTGTAVVPNYSGTNIRFKDEDLGCWWLPSPEWLRAFVGADIPGLAVEDVFAAAYNDAESTMYLTILGSGRVAGHKVTQKDIFAIDYSDSSWGGYVWRGPEHGWNYKIDAFEFGGW